MKQKYKITLEYIFIISVLWVSITTTIQAFKCAEMTQQELFLRIPESIVLNFTQCN